VTQVNKKIPLSELKKSEQIVVRTGKNNFIDKLIFPNPVTIGLDDSNLRSLLTTEGGIKINPAVPIDTQGTLYNNSNSLYFNGEPLLSGGKNLNLFFNTKTNTLALTGSLVVDSSGNIASKSLTGSLTQLQDGAQYIKSGRGISVVTGSNGQLTIAALAQDGGIRASSVGTALGNVSDSLHGKTLIFIDAIGRSVTFTYDKNIEVASPSRISAVSYKIGCKNITTDKQHAQGVKNAIDLAHENNDLSILTSLSDQVITLTQEKGGITGNTAIEGTAIDSSLIDFINENSFEGGSALLASVNAQYLTLAASDDLNNERVMTAGTGLVSSDEGPGSTFTLSIDDSVVPRKNVSNTFSGAQIFSGEIRGTHQKLADGSSAFIAGKNVSITNNKNGSITISSTDTDTKYSAGNGLSLAGNQFAVKVGPSLQFSGGSLAVNTTGLAGSFLSNDGTGKLKVNLSAGRGLTDESNNIVINTDDFAGLGLKSDGEKIFIDDSKVAMISGTNFTGKVNFIAGLSGSLTRLTSGKSFLAAGDNVTIVTQSDGQITISSSYVDTTYLPGPGLELSGTLFSVALKTNGGLIFDDTEVALDTLAVIGEGLTGGTSGLIAVDPAKIAFLTGTKFEGQVNFDAGLRGSLTKLVDGSDYIIAGSNIAVTTQSNGSIVISSTASGSASPAGVTGDIQVNVSGSLSTFGGLYFDDASDTLNAPKIAATSLTGSLTKLSDGNPFIVSGPNITITTSSIGQITIAGAPTTLVASRNRVVYVVTSTHPAHTPLTVAGVDFSSSNFAHNLIDITCNGALLYSGSSFERDANIVDYSLYSSDQITFAFDLMPDDVIQAVSLMSGSDTVTVSPGGVTGLNGSVQFNNAGNFDGDSLFVYNHLENSLSVPSITGSLTRLVTNEPFLTTTGTIISISTGSNGGITISDSYASVPAVVYDETFAVGEAKYITASGPLLITTSSNSIVVNMQRDKVIHEITSSHPANVYFTIPGAHFSSANFDDKRIDIFVNGQLLVSGSSKDYELTGSDDQIRLSFDLIENDVIVAVIQ
jgi:hypothetical protein